MFMKNLVLIIGLCGLLSVVAAGPGELLWQFPTGGEVWSAPAIADDGTIYFGSLDSHLYALDPDGTLKWQLPHRRPDKVIGRDCPGRNRIYRLGRLQPACGQRGWQSTLAIPHRR